MAHNPDRPVTVAADVADYGAFARAARRPLTITVVGGAGYVGAVTAVGFAHLGHQVTAADMHPQRLGQLARGESPFYEPHLQDLLQGALRTGAIRFTTPQMGKVPGGGIVFIAVNTPRRDDGEADLADIIQVAMDLGQRWRNYSLVVLKSTAPVGSHLTLRRVLEQFGLHDGSNYDLVANPEFLREGSAVYDFFYPDRVVIGGQSPKGVAAVRELFDPLGAPILETTIENAQMIKYASNAFLATRVSFINEIANICEHIGADTDVVAHGLGFDKRIGHSYLRPGIGFSGPCLPKDLEGLIRLSEDAGYEPLLLKAVLEKNAHQRRQILGKVYAMLGTPLYGRRIGVLGLVFKPGTSDIRNSAAATIVDHLIRRGAEVRVFDPMVRGVSESPAPLAGDAYDAAEGADLLLVLTAWPEFAQLDFGRIRRLMRALWVVDGVNVLSPAVLQGLGFTYVGVGRRPRG